MERFFCALSKQTRRVLAYVFLAMMWLCIVVVLTIGIAYAVCGDDWVDNNISGKHDTNPYAAAMSFIIPSLCAFNFWMLYFDCRKRGMKEYMNTQDVYVKEGVINQEEKFKIKGMIGERIIEETKIEKRNKDKLLKLEEKISNSLAVGEFLDE